MSGRVRWERARVDRGLGSTDVCGFMAGGVAFEAVRYDDTAPTYATHYDRDGAPDVDRTFRRRSDAKRWLLARAAGLAEGPRYRAREAATRPASSDGSRLLWPWWRIGGVVPPPRGWRVVAPEIIERNRRRR